MADLGALRGYVVTHASNLGFGEGSGNYPRLPEFDLFPRDYLTAAEQDFAASRTASGKRQIISRNACVGHLKQALECAVDVFLGVFGLYKVSEKRNLTLENKLSFLESVDVATARSLRRLNTARNKIEHDYAAPDVPDLELYLDLVTTFVAMLERSTLLAKYSDVAFMLIDEYGNDLDAGVAFTYDFEKPSLTFEWGDGFREGNITVSPLTDHDVFAEAFKIMLLLIQLDHFVSAGYVSTALSDTSGA